MKPLVQKLPLPDNLSFVAQTFRTPHFEVGWHQHVEYELILFTEGSGLCFVDNYVGEFQTGDIYFLGPNLPHTFQKSGDQIASAVVVQFREECWGPRFFQLEESRQLKKLLDNSLQGLKVQGKIKEVLAPMIRQLETSTGFRRILLLAECLNHLAGQKDYLRLSTRLVRSSNHKDKECIDSVIQFTIDSFPEPISLSRIAGIAHLSIAAFCTYFKRHTQKTYIDFLNEVRISYACTLLVETGKPVVDICYECGYNTMVHFHKQFLKRKNMTPLQYRRSFAGDIIRRGSNTGIVTSSV